jgi:anti-sigma factor RsiW
MTHDPRDLEEVRRRLEEIQRRKRGGIRWKMSRHTAELAISAIEAAAPEQDRSAPAGRGKQRRRKRRKRLL